MTAIPSSSAALEDEVARTKILLLGQRRSGKTSIQQILFNDADPKQTFYFEPTIRIMKHKHDTIIPLEIWDCPGNITVDTLGAPLSTFALIIFVIDIQDSVQQPIARLLQFFTAAFQESPATALEVFVHKAEAIQEYKNDSFRHIQDRIIGELEDMPGFETMPLDFHLTSIYDHSLYGAFSELITKVVDSLPDLEQLLDIFCANSQASKAYLFDIKSRLYVATDTSPPDQAYNLCCDYLKTMNSFGSLYKSVSDSPARVRTISSGSYPPSGKPSFYPSAAMKLADPTQGTTMTYHVVTPQLALVALLPTSVWEGRRGLVEYNVVYFREGVQEIWAVEMEARREAAAEVASTV